MIEPGQSKKSGLSLSLRDVVGLVVVVGLLGSLFVFSRFMNAIGEDTGYDVHEGGTASEATSMCREFIEMHANSLPVRVPPPEVHGKDGWWVVSGTAVIGKQASQTREAFNCHVAHDDPDEWSLISLCPTVDSDPAERRFLKATDYRCDPVLAREDDPQLPPGYVE